MFLIFKLTRETEMFQNECKQNCTQKLQDVKLKLEKDKCQNAASEITCRLL